MTVEDRFPVGMRVLAVDDDPTCLKVLDNLLRRCHYDVTTTGQAITALKLLRENKDKFDLVISDVHMPNMDGFKLLELVGLEMDLPVIMLSANSDTKAVMKGITHGACDYLLKPVRIEELKNIWQHVIRRKTVDCRDHNNTLHGDDGEKLRKGVGGGQGHVDDGRHNKKRKDQAEEDDDDGKENGHGNDGSATQKKPRVVWSVELHKKFVDCVNYFGVDKAVPKKILELMNVEKLTRENVASHLQKYRLFLKKISCMESQQENVAAVFAGKDHIYVPVGSLDALGDFHDLAGSRQLPNSSLSSFQGGRMISQLNNPAGLGLCGPNSSDMIQLSHLNYSSNSINDLGKLQQAALHGNPHAKLLLRMSPSLDLDQLRQKKPVSHVREFSPSFNDSMAFPLVPNQLTAFGSSTDTRVSSGSCSTSYLNVADDLLLHDNQQQIVCGRLRQQSSIEMAPLNRIEPLDSGFGVLSHLPSHVRCNDTWKNAAPLAGYSTELLPVGGSLSFNDLISGREARYQASRAGVDMLHVLGGIHENSTVSKLGSMASTVGLNSNYAPKKLQDHRSTCAHKPNVLFDCPQNSLLPNHGFVDTINQNSDQSNAICDNKMDVTSIDESISGALYHLQHSMNDKSSTNNPIKLTEDFLLEHAKMQGGLDPSNCSSFDDLMSQW